MAGFIDYDLPSNYDERVQDAFDRIRLAFPGWEPNDNQLETVVIQEIIRASSETATVAVDVARSIFRTFGEKVLDLFPIDGNGAAMLATITAVDGAGYQLPAGSPVGWQQTGDVLRVFRLMADATIPTGQAVITNVPLVAEEFGTDLNGIPVGTNLTSIETLAWIQSIVTTTESSGGVDPETDDEYLDRLSENLRLLADRAILPEDFAALARNVEGVHRAVAIDGWNPANNTANNERMIAVAAVDANGLAIGAGVKNDLDAYLEGKRETTFVVNVMDPTFTDIDVVFAAVAKPGYVAAEVEAAAEAAVADFIHPRNWAGGSEEPPEWRNDKVVRYLEIAEVINNVPGIDYITTTAGNFDLTVNGARLDVTLAGQAALPSPPPASSVNGTVV